MERPCGCPSDYHMADCPILTSRYDEPDYPDVDSFYDHPGWGDDEPNPYYGTYSEC